MYKTPNRRIENCPRLATGSTKAQDPRWGQSRSRAVSLPDTGAAIFSKCRMRANKCKKYLNGIEPGSTFTRAEASPFLPHRRGGATSTDVREEEGVDDRDAEDVKESHPFLRMQGTRIKAPGATLIVRV